MLYAFDSRKKCQPPIAQTHAWVYKQCVDIDNGEKAREDVGSQGMEGGGELLKHKVGVYLYLTLDRQVDTRLLTTPRNLRSILCIVHWTLYMDTREIMVAWHYVNAG